MFAALFTNYTYKYITSHVVWNISTSDVKKIFYFLFFNKKAFLTFLIFLQRYCE